MSPSSPPTVLPDSPYHSRAAGRDTEHTLSLLEPHLGGVGTVLDVGCGSGYVAWQLGRRFQTEVHAVDIDDLRRVPLANFARFDGRHLPFPDGRFDMVLFSFVLHHIPDVSKPLLLSEARRVARQKVVILEDTPRGVFDRLASWCHGWRFSRRVRSRERFGFLAADEWLRLFDELGLGPAHVQPLSRWSRAPSQPFARSLFVLDVAAGQVK